MLIRLRDKDAIGDTALGLDHLPRCIEHRHIRPNNGTMIHVDAYLQYAFGCADEVVE